MPARIQPGARYDSHIHRLRIDPSAAVPLPATIAHSWRAAALSRLPTLPYQTKITTLWHSDGLLESPLFQLPKQITTRNAPLFDHHQHFAAHATFTRALRNVRYCLRIIDGCGARGASRPRLGLVVSLVNLILILHNNTPPIFVASPRIRRLQGTRLQSL